MIVVDTNVIGYLLLTSPHSREAEQTLLRDPHWVAPVLWRSEFRSVLSSYLRQQLLTLEDTLAIMDEATSLMLTREYEVASFQVLRLVADSQCSAYDCEFVALALSLGVPLVTGDRQIQQQFPHVAISLGDFAAGRGTENASQR